MNAFFFDRRSGIAAMGGLVLAIVFGCDAGQKMGAASGRVLFDGKPYGKAAVVFFSMTTGGGASSNLADDGSFSLPTKLPAGDYCVYLAPAEVATRSDDAPPAGVEIDKNIPDRYWSESLSDIVVALQPGANEFTIELNSSLKP